MNIHVFAVRLDRVPTDAECDRLYEAGLDDANVEINGAGTEAMLAVHRQADTLAAAITSVVRDIAKAGLAAVGVGAQDRVSISEIAAKVRRSPESVRLLAAGKRGPGGFPAPRSAGRYAFYSWAQVRRWFAEHFALPDDEDADTLLAADLLLRARTLASFPELAGLLRTA